MAKHQVVACCGGRSKQLDVPQPQVPGTEMQQTEAAIRG